MFLTHALRAIYRAVVATTDPYFKYVSMLLTGNPPASTFVADASTNNFAVVVNGDTKPNSFNPYTPGYYSNYFDGSGDYLTVGANANLSVGTSDFTIEAWVNLASGSAYQFLMGSSANGGMMIGISVPLGTPASTIAVGTHNVAWVLNFGGSISIVSNTWTHVAITRSGSTNRAFINGVQLGSNITDSTNWAFSSNAPYIAYNAASGNLTGYISNLRVVKGTAVYTSAFTPPTSPLTAIANTSLLTCQSNRFIDTSANNFAITVSGNTKIQAFDPFTPDSAYSTYGSGYFDGTGDYLSTPANAALAFGSGDFCLEFWIHTTAFGSTGSRPLGNNTNWAANAWSLHSDHGTANEKYTFWVNNYNSGSPMFTSTASAVLNTWTHVAITRNGTSWRMFVDGVQQGSTVTSSVALDGGSSGVLYIGGSGAANEYVTGYMSSVRAVKGTAVYTTAFTPPTAPLTAISGTSLLTLQTNQPTTNNVFLDNSTNNYTVVRNGTPTLGTFSPFGANWSNYFDGSTAYLTTSSSAISYAGDFTVECWFNTRTTTTYACIYSDETGSTGGTILLNNGSNNGQITVYIGSVVVNFASTTTGLNNGAWNHVALSRSGSTLRLFINGALENTTTVSGTLTTSSTFGIANSFFPNRYFGGYISNFRVTNTAVYTAAFTPSTTPLTAISGTSLLTCQSNRFKDTSANNFTVTKNGDVSVQRFSPFSPSASYSTNLVGGSGRFATTGNTAANISATLTAATMTTWTIEMFTYAETSTITDQVLLGPWSPTLIRVSGGTLQIYLAGNNRFSISGALPTNQWNHLAICCDSTDLRVYVNGVRLANSVGEANLSINLTDVVLGAQATSSTANDRWPGYISNFRLLQGTALYTGTTCTVPTAPLPAITNTKLLLSMTSAAVIDNAMMNDLETVGDAKISTSVVKYGTGSLAFDGTGDYLTTVLSQNLQFGTGDFTIELWTYFISRGPNGTCFIGNYNSFTTGALALFAGHGSANTSKYQVAYNGVFPSIQSTTSIITNQWAHIALVRSGTTITLYINGTADGTATGASASLNGVGSSMFIGTAGDAPTNYVMNGYIDDLRITKGYARYTANFTPPTASFPTA